MLSPRNYSINLDRGMPSDFEEWHFKYVHTWLIFPDTDAVQKDSFDGIRPRGRTLSPNTKSVILF